MLFSRLRRARSASYSCTSQRVLRTYFWGFYIFRKYYYGLGEYPHRYWGPFGLGGSGDIRTILIPAIEKGLCLWAPELCIFVFVNKNQVCVCVSVCIYIYTHVHTYILKYEHLYTYMIMECAYVCRERVWTHTHIYISVCVQHTHINIYNMNCYADMFTHIHKTTYKTTYQTQRITT